MTWAELILVLFFLWIWLYVAARVVARAILRSIDERTGNGDEEKSLP